MTSNWLEMPSATSLKTFVCAWTAEAPNKTRPSSVSLILVFFIRKDMSLGYLFFKYMCKFTIHAVAILREEGLGSLFAIFVRVFGIERDGIEKRLQLLFRLWQCLPETLPL